MTDETQPTEQPHYKRGEHPNSAANLNKFGTEEGNKNHHSVAGGNKPWSIRNSLRHIASQPIDQSDANAFKLLLPPKPTVAQIIAANTLAKATKSDMRAVEYVTEQIDGKLAQTNINADFAAILGMTDDELTAIVDGADSATAARAREDGATPESGSETPA